MTAVRCLLLVPLAIGLTAASAARAQPAKTAPDPTDPKSYVPTQVHEDPRDLTNLPKVGDRTFRHTLSKVEFTLPDGWKEIRPHRLPRTIDTDRGSVLGIERPARGRDREWVASLYWIRLNPGQTLADYVRTELVRGEYGEEYETLKAVYGAGQVSIPRAERLGTADVYRIDITGGPGAMESGCLFVFAVQGEGATWLLKARVTFPKGDEKAAADVINGYKLPPGAGVKAKAPAAEGEEKDSGKR